MKKTGFTIIELIVVVAIIGVLATIVIVNVNGYIYKARKASVLADYKAAANAAVIYVESGGASGQFCSNTNTDIMNIGFSISKLGWSFTCANDLGYLSIPANSENYSYTNTIYNVNCKNDEWFAWSGYNGSYSSGVVCADSKGYIGTKFTRNISKCDCSTPYTGAE